MQEFFDDLESELGDSKLSGAAEAPAVKPQ